MRSLLARDDQERPPTHEQYGRQRLRPRACYQETRQPYNKKLEEEKKINHHLAHILPLPNIA